jgi:hypothetical protein
MQEDQYYPLGVYAYGVFHLRKLHLLLGMW